MASQQVRSKTKDTEAYSLIVDLLKEYFKALTSVSAALITALVGIYKLSPRIPYGSNDLVLYSATGYLVAVIAGIVAYGALISSVHRMNDPYKNKVVVGFSLLQWIAFITATLLLVLALRTIIADP